VSQLRLHQRSRYPVLEADTVQDVATIRQVRRNDAVNDDLVNDHNPFDEMAT